MNPSTRRVAVPEAAGLSRAMAERLGTFLRPLLAQLEARLDVRLVRTFAAAVVALVGQHPSSVSLVLTELGEGLTDGAHVPAAVKRLWRLVHSPKWDAALVDTWLAEQATAAIERALKVDGLALAVLDDSEVEKPAAHALDGLCFVRSSRARRLQRASGGPPPPRPTLVPGFGWVAVVISGLSGSLTLARMHWFSPTRTEGAERRREAEWRTILPFLLLWEQQVLWVVDRGFASASFLGEALGRVRFLARWRQDYILRERTSGQEAKTSQLSRRVRSQWTTQLWDPWRHQTWTVGVATLPVALPDDPRPLWLVVARRKGKSQTLWLLTSEEASTEKAALRLVRAYARRWQVEWAFRFEKTGLGLPSVRVFSWTYREKLWRLAELVHAFLLWLLVMLEPRAREQLLQWCHRTGAKARAAVAPLDRLRRALGNVWEKERPTIRWSPSFTSNDSPSTLLPIC